MNKDNNDNNEKKSNLSKNEKMKYRQEIISSHSLQGPFTMDSKVQDITLP